MSNLSSDIDKIINNKKDKIDGKVNTSNSIFKFEPVWFKEFVEDKEYCNFIKLTKRQLDACYAILYSCTYEEFLENKNAINKNIFDKPMFNLAVLEWGKGSGKDTVCSLLTFYCAYFLMCCINPQQLLGLPDNEAIDIVNVAYSGDQATRVFFEKLKQRVMHNLWLKKHFDIKISNQYIGEKDIYDLEDEIKIGTNAIIFPNLVRLFSRHSEQESTEGLNLLMFTMDEADAFKDKTKSRNAEKIFNMLQTSAESRFGNRYKGFVISYPRTDKGFIKRMVKLAEKDLHIYADTAFTWEVKEELYASNDTFIFDAVLKDEKGKEFRKNFEIPIDFKSSFDRNPTIAKMMYMCLPPGAESPFIEYPERIKLCIDEFRKPILELENYYEDGKVRKRMKRWNIGMDDKIFTMTIDLGEKHDKCAMSLMHREGLTAMHDFSDTWKPIEPITKTKYMVDFLNVRDIIKEISKRIKIQVWFDRWQSSMMIQDLKKDGISADSYSLSVRDYNNFMEFLYSRRIILLDIQELSDEIEALERTDKGTVDHTDESEKDLTDTVVGGIRQLFIEEVKQTSEGGEFIEDNLGLQSGEIINSSV